ENVIQRMVVLAPDEVARLELDSVPKYIVEERLDSVGEPTSVVYTDAVLPVSLDPVSLDPVSLDPVSLDPVSREDADVSAEPAGGSEGFEFRLPEEGISLADVEADLIRQALERSNGRLEPASRLLGITYKTLQYRVKKYRLQYLQR
ncbi:MAG: helix-turn-helix domain-containing protein, partial [Planctomycetota bacterium]